jgi:hypothetical protein
MGEKYRIEERKAQLMVGKKRGKNKSCKMMLKEIKQADFLLVKCFGRMPHAEYEKHEKLQPNKFAMKLSHCTEWTAGWTPGRPGERSELCFVHCFQTLGSKRLLAKQMPEGYHREKADGAYR